MKAVSAQGAVRVQCHARNSRRRRIAIGSGTSTAEVNRLLKQFVEMQRMMKMISGGKMPRMGGGLGALLGR